jgi:hypothetical protein
MPESMHMIMWAMSDRGIPCSLRMIEGFGVHSFRLLDAEGRSTFVKFHWRPLLGAQSTLWDEAVKIAGADPDFHRGDLFEAIEAGNFPAWELAVQLFGEEDAAKFPFDHFDATPSIVFDAVAVIVNNSAAARLAKEAAACDFLRHAFGHLKAIAFSEDAKPLLEACGIKEALRDEGVVAAEDVERFIAAASTRQWEREAKVHALA